jgi:hypothetical protein
MVEHQEDSPNFVITPEMLSAGVHEMACSDPYAGPLEIVEAVYIAMRALEPSQEPDAYRAEECGRRGAI